MEEKKTKKLNKKTLLICLAIALVFAIIGIVDINVNAAESETYSLSVNRIDYRIGSDGKTCLDGYPVANNVMSITSDAPIDVYYYQSVDTLSSDSYTEYSYVLSSGQIYLNGSPFYWGTVNINGVNYYWSVLSQFSATFANVQGYYELEFNGADKIYKLNTLSYQPNEYGRNKFFSDLRNGTLDCTQEIDYDSLEVDYNMPTIQNVRTNRIKNWVSSGLYNQYFDYITWDSNEQYEVQVQKVFSVYFTRKVDGKTRFLGAEYNQETIHNEMFEKCTNSFTQQTDMQYISDERSDDFQFYSDVRKTTDIDNWEKSEICFCYMVRYVDVNNLKAGPWCYILPFENIGDYDQTFTCSYQLEDGSTTENFVPSGTNEDYKDFEEIGGIDNAKDTIDAENKFKDEYVILDGDVDVQEATNWLNTVVSFIKGTPQVVGSVLGFLPQPILSGMYVTIFLGVIASAIAIAKALF